MHSGSAQVILRNNRKLLKKRRRKTFGYNPGNLGEIKKDKYDHVVLDPKLLMDIKTRLVKENKALRKKRLIAFVIVFIGLIIGVGIIL